MDFILRAISATEELAGDRCDQILALQKKILLLAAVWRVDWGQKSEKRVNGGLIQSGGKGNGGKWADLSND